MNEEEKKAIANLKHIVEHWKPDDEEDELANIEYNSIKIAVNLITKQQKEIEELKIKEFIIPEIANEKEADMWVNRIRINDLIKAIKQIDKKIK